MDDIAAYYVPPPPASYSYYQEGVPPPQTPPPYIVYAPPLPLYAHNEVRTLFVAGLPEDVKAREIYNLFREFPGYESSHLRSASENNQPFAFAVFSDQQSALAAMHAVNGMVFDLEKGSTLYIDLAKSNPRSKRSRTDDDWPGSDKRARGPTTFSRGTLDSGFGSIHLPGMGSSAHNTIGYPPSQRAGNEGPASKPSHSSAPPCPTLFVANLGLACTEQELIEVFSRCPGFLKLKMQSTYGTPVAFVDFQDTASSTSALHHLQGTVLYSSVSGQGMRLEYAKSRMGMRRKPK